MLDELVAVCGALRIGENAKGHLFRRALVVDEGSFVLDLELQCKKVAGAEGSSVMPGAVQQAERVLVEAIGKGDSRRRVRC